MAKVSYISVPPDVKGFYDKLVTPLYKTKNSSVRFGGGLIPPRKVVNVTSKSLLPQIKTIWATFDAGLIDDWKVAAAAVGYTGWQLFVQEMCYRIKFGISGEPTPTILYSYKVGQMETTLPNTNFSIVQVHPIQYYRMKKVRGTKSQYEPVAIQEQLLLPLEFGMSFRANLTVSGSNPIIRAYAGITRSYQGLDLVDNYGFDIPLVCDWSREIITVSDVVGVARWYSLFIELNDVVGILQFDNLIAQHSGTNYARDFRSTNISSGYSNTNYQIPPSWAAVGPAAGATFGSVYPTTTL